MEYDTRLTEGFYKEYNPDEDEPCGQKKNPLYWAGTTFDGYYQDSNLKDMQRVRLVKDMNNASKPIVLLHHLVV